MGSSLKLVADLSRTKSYSYFCILIFYQIQLKLRCNSIFDIRNMRVNCKIIDYLYTKKNFIFSLGGIHLEIRKSYKMAILHFLDFKEL